MERIVIIGLGQIGGSIGMALKRAKLRSAQIVGVDIDRGNAAKAQRKGAVDQTERLRAEVVEDAALVIVATPILAMKEVFQEIAAALPVGCVVTDTGSTKEQILKWAEDILPHHVSFVGGHPMAGREIQGIDGADPNLFNERPYCIVPSLNASKGAVQMVVDMANAIKGVPYFVDAPEHDVLVGGISHLPLFLSAALVAVTTRSQSWREMARLASTGYRDVSRLASTDPKMSLGITLTNRLNLIRWLDGCVDVLKEYRDTLANGGDGILEEMERVWEAREQWVNDAIEPYKDKALEDVPNATDAMGEFVVGKWAMDRLRKMDEIAEKGMPRKDNEDRGS